MGFKPGELEQSVVMLLLDQESANGPGPTGAAADRSQRVRTETVLRRDSESFGRNDGRGGFRWSGIPAGRRDWFPAGPARPRASSHEPEVICGPRRRHDPFGRDR